MDAQILLYINSFSSPELDQVMLVITALGNVSTVLIVSFAIATVLYRMQRWKPLAFVALSVIGTLVMNSCMKLLFMRERPELWDLLTHESTYSFPSGHAAMSCALALTVIVLAWNSRWRWPVVGIGIIYVVFVSFSRLYLGVHYPSDILAGWIVASLWVFVAFKLAQAIPIKRRSRDIKIDHVLKK